MPLAQQCSPSLARSRSTSGATYRATTTGVEMASYPLNRTGPTMANMWAEYVGPRIFHAEPSKTTGLGGECL
eukprot:12070850-Alexandrium_andersonii.AAC.1